MNFLIGLYDKLIDSIIEKADLDNVKDNQNEIAIKCVTCPDPCNIENCSCRCHFRSCGKCDNENCDVKTCTCTCHGLENLKNKQQAEELHFNDNKSDNSDNEDETKDKDKLASSKNIVIDRKKRLGKTILSKDSKLVKKKIVRVYFIHTIYTPLYFTIITYLIPYIHLLTIQSYYYFFTFIYLFIFNTFFLYSIQEKKEKDDSMFGFDTTIDDQFIVDDAVREVVNKQANKDKILRGFVARFLPPETKDEHVQILALDFESLMKVRKQNEEFEKNPELRKKEEEKKKEAEKQKEDEKNKEIKKRMQSKFGNFIMGIIDKTGHGRLDSNNSIINLKRADGSVKDGLNHSLNSKYNYDGVKSIIKFKPKKDMLEKKKSKLMFTSNLKEKQSMELSFSPFRSKAKKEMNKMTTSFTKNNMMNESGIITKDLNNSINIPNQQQEKSILGARIKKSFKVNRISDLKTPEMLEDTTDEKFVRDKGKITHQIKNLNLQLSKSLL